MLDRSATVFKIGASVLRSIDGDGSRERHLDRATPADSATPVFDSAQEFLFNHAWWYVAEVLRWARRYRAAASSGVLATAPSQTVVRVDAAATWLAPLPGTDLRCDARIIADVEYILETFDLRATSCFRSDGAGDLGEHPLGLALDAVPVDGNWSHALDAAETFGWKPSCGASGCAGVMPAPMRFIGYNGYPDHGDPAHAGANAHIHFSWLHAPSAPYTQAAWVDVFAVPGESP
ncbi:MAG TPA: hypothetical protein VGG41_08650 [Solirubrobacteraceae bacterium]